MTAQDETSTRRPQPDVQIFYFTPHSPLLTVRKTGLDFVYLWKFFKFVVQQLLCNRCITILLLYKGFENDCSTSLSKHTLKNWFRWTICFSFLLFFMYLSYSVSMYKHKTLEKPRDWNCRDAGTTTTTKMDTRHAALKTTNHTTTNTHNYYYFYYYTHLPTSTTS